MRIRFAGKETELARLAIDFPRQGERVRSAHYAVRVSARPALGPVEISIDHGRWLPCHSGAGFWWFDWTGYANGTHRIIARLKTTEGELVTCEAHEICVELEPGPLPVS